MLPAAALQPAGTQWMLPSQSWESAEIGVRRYHRATVLDRNRRVLSIGHQLPRSAGLTAQPLEYLQMIGARTHDARGRAFHERGNECDGLVERGWGVKNPRVGYHAHEAGQDQDREGERFRPRRQTRDPRRILGMFGNGVLDVGIDQDIYVGKQHPESPAPVPEPGLVILRVERPRPVEIDARARLNPPHRHQPERRRLRPFATLQSVIQRLGDKRADADAAGFGCTPHLLCKLVVKGNGGSHDALA